MEKSVKNAVFKGFPVLMESGTFGSKQDSQTTNKEINNSQGNFSRGFYLVPKQVIVVTIQGLLRSWLWQTHNKKCSVGHNSL